MLGLASGVKDTGQLHSCEAWEGRSVGRLAYYGHILGTFSFKPFTLPERLMSPYTGGGPTKLKQVAI